MPQQHRLDKQRNGSGWVFRCVVCDWTAHMTRDENYYVDDWGDPRIDHQAMMYPLPNDTNSQAPKKRGLFSGWA